LEFRSIKKLLSTYIDPLPCLISPSTGKIHTTYNQSLTATGRLSSVKPNLQNIPIRTERGKEIRKAFIPSNPQGFIMSSDYSQIELRLMAHMSEDPDFIDAFRAGKDIHAATASKIFNIPEDQLTKEQRNRAKVANFGIIYGISAFGLSQRLKISRAESKKLIEDYFSSYPQVKEYISGMIEYANINGFVKTLYGRKRYLPDINSKNQIVRGLAERNAVNAPIQGSAADIIKVAMLKVNKRIKEEKLESKMVLQVHDELVFDVIPGEIDILKKVVKEEMESVIKLSVPLTVDCQYGANWLEAH
jgi:DNA polymerase-1